MDKNLLDKAREEINEIDRQMAELFARRMRAVDSVAKYKRENGLAVLDEKREMQVIERNLQYVEEEKLRSYYKRFIKNTMAVSRDYQRDIIAKEGVIHLSLDNSGYDIILGRGIIKRAREFFNLERRVLIVTDDGVPKEYSKNVASLSKEARIVTVEQGEKSKSVECLKAICLEMLDYEMTRTDCVVAVGGGVVGDLAGLAAATYMRGVDFYNIPTTLLSQVDSSIGGKTAVNLGGVKNILGSFYQPCAVIIDPDLLSTLPERHFNNGMAEVIKMATTSDKELFELLEMGDAKENIEEIIERSIRIKKAVVEEDEREGGARKILNFGHTLGHGIEAAEGMQGLYHGECVSIGMTVCVSDSVKERLVSLLKKNGLPVRYEGDITKAAAFIRQDKKREGDSISAVFVDEIGSCRIEKMDADGFYGLVLKEYGI